MRGPDDYWLFGRYERAPRKRGETVYEGKPFKAGPAALEGFDIPLQTTPFPRQYDAPGGLPRLAEPGYGPLGPPRAGDGGRIVLGDDSRTGGWQDLHLLRHTMLWLCADNEIRGEP
ncbi:MAG: hypothetical protein K9N51_13665 [Candidatus Pacebacteria bacterium]|nr:hypothetical protein [Candidatus Paceibacterota bacterium]